MVQLSLDFTPPTHRTRRLAHEAAQGRKADAYRRLLEVFRAAGRAGLTADEACERAGLGILYGRPRVSELLRDELALVDPPDIPRRTFQWPCGGPAVTGAVLVLADAWGDPAARLLALGAAENLLHPALTPGRDRVE